MVNFEEDILFLPDDILSTPIPPVSSASPSYGEHAHSPYRFGIPDDELQDITLPDQCDSSLHWPESAWSPDTKPDEDVLIPSPPLPDPEPFVYPQAPIYKLAHIERDACYTRGWYYVANYYQADAEAMRKRLLLTTTPPQVYAELQPNGTFLYEDVPGCHNMKPGLPYCVYINGDVRRRITICTVHTLDSLKPYSDFPQALRHSNNLRNLTFGTESKDGHKGIPPIYSVGLQRNMRSAKPTSDDDPNGSVNFTSIKKQGQGTGVGAPASQIDTPAVVWQKQQIIRTLYLLYRIVIEKSISKEEHDSIDFRSDDINAFTAGGMKSGPSSCQGNFSNSDRGGDLGRFIGKLQGYWHVDIGDDIARWTFLVLLFRLPPGAFSSLLLFLFTMSPLCFRQ